MLLIGLPNPHLVIFAKLRVVLVWAQAAVRRRQLLLQARRDLIQLYGPAREVVSAGRDRVGMGSRLLCGV